MLVWAADEMEPALRRGDRADGVGGGVWRIVALLCRSLHARIKRMINYK